MNWNASIRQLHRWVSIAFVVAVVAVTAVVLAVDEPAGWVYVFPGLSLVLLVLTGLNLFLMPYLSRRGPVERPTSAS